MSRSVFYLFILLMLSCAEAKVEPQTQVNKYHDFSGKTMGTTYKVIFQGDGLERIQSKVDSLLKAINLGVSTYIPESVISLFNDRYETYLQNMPNPYYDHFAENYQIATSIYGTSKGAFEPTIMPIVNYWGFGYTGKNKVSKADTNEIKKLMASIGFDRIYIEDDLIKKQTENIQLDYSAVAKGYAVDKVSDLLNAEDITNHYVEIGGEVFTQGVNNQGSKWRIGISVPSPVAAQTDFQQIIEISDKGIATSGNYRNFYESEGEIFSHTINPLTGFPERSNLLSATILAPTCAIADGYATACMVLGLEKSKEMINLQPEIEGILIYSNEEGELQVFDSQKI